jgi:hypothetical protein
MLPRAAGRRHAVRVRPTEAARRLLAAFARLLEAEEGVLVGRGAEVNRDWEHQRPSGQPKPQPTGTTVSPTTHKPRPASTPKTTVPADSARPGHASAAPSRARAALQDLVALSAPGADTRADRSGDASTLSVASGRTSARGTMTSPHGGQAWLLTWNTPHNCTP